MITKNRLEELIKEEATIHYCYEDECQECCQNTGMYVCGVIELSDNLEDYEFHHDDVFMFVEDDVYEYKWLYETIEETYHVKDFGNITRTETLSLPRWEEVEKSIIGRVGLEICKFNEIDFYINKVFNAIRITTPSIPDIEYEDYLFNKPLTKENYIKACQLAKELFLKGNK